MKVEQRYANEKGECKVTASGQTCLSTKEEVFRAFTKRVAILAFGIKSDNWDHVIKMFPELELERQIVERHVNENVKVDEIKLVMV